MNTERNLCIFLAWLGSNNCKEEMFDTIPNYGLMDASLDEVIAETIYELRTLKEKKNG